MSILEDEDESGWQKVKTSDGRVGLVPSSYIQAGGAAHDASSSSQKAQEPEGKQGLSLDLVFSGLANLILTSWNSSRAL